MTLKTILWFAGGGVFAHFYKNLTLKYHPLKTPLRLVFYTSIGAAIGYQVSKFEENFEELMIEKKKYDQFTSYIPKQELLTYQAMIRRNQELEATSDFEISEEEEDEE